MSERGLQELQKQGVFGNDRISSLRFYEDCILGKTSRLKFETIVNTTKDKLRYTHFNLWGPTHVTYLGSYKYFVSFIDDYSRMVQVYVLKNEDEVLERFK